MGNVNATTTVVTNINDITNYIESHQCEKNDTISSISNVEIDIKNSACKFIQVGSQDSVTTCQGVFDGVLDTAINNATNVGDVDNSDNSSAWKSAIDAVAGNLDININTDVVTNETTAKNTIRQMCGNQNRTTSEIRSASLNLNGVSCETLQVFNQKANSNIRCVALVNQKFNEITGTANQPQKNWVSNTFKSLLVPLIVGFVLLIILIVVIVFVVRHHQQAKADSSNVKPIPS